MYSFFQFFTNMINPFEIPELLKCLANEPLLFINLSFQQLTITASLQYPNIQGSGRVRLKKKKREKRKFSKLRQNSLVPLPSIVL